MGPPRHLALIGPTQARQIDWPVPFADGIAEMLALRGQNVVVLASGDPFWFGAGAVIARHLDRAEWRALPNLSTFALVAARLGWGLEQTTCLGLHAAPLTRLRPYLAAGADLIVLLRDGASVSQAASVLCDLGFGASTLEVFEAVGGPKERHTRCTANSLDGLAFSHPVCVAIRCAGGPALPKAAGLPDALFHSDGTMTKSPVRALTLSALAPRPSEMLWDIGGGSGSVALEWLLAHPTTQACTIEPRADRLDNIRANAIRLGVDRVQIVHGAAPRALADLPMPQAVFIGGGLSEPMLDHLFSTLPPGTRLVANGVTLESETLLAQWHSRKGGTLMRIDIAQAAPLGSKRGWRASYPIVQWSVGL